MTSTIQHQPASSSTRPRAHPSTMATELARPRGRRLKAELPTNLEGMRLAAYIRISLDRAEQTSTGSQLEEIRACAAAHGATIVEIYEERVSASGSRHMPVYDSVMLDAQADRWDGVVAWRLDRWNRKGAADTLASISYLNSLGKHWMSATEPRLDTSSTLGEMFIAIMASVARLESEARAERARAWHATRKVPSSAPPFGIAPGWTGPDLEAAPIVREGAEQLLSGTSLRQLGAQWAAAGHAGRKWGVSAIKQLMGNPALVAYGVLEAETQQLVAKALHSRNPHAPGAATARRGVPQQLLSGLAKCVCGGKVMSTTANGTKRYRCEECSVSVTVSNVDPMVESWLFANVSCAQLLLAAQGLGSVAPQLEELASRRAAQLRMHAKGLVTDEELETSLEELAGHQTALEASRSHAAELPAMRSQDELSQLWGLWGLEERRAVVAASLVATIHPWTPGTDKRQWDASRLELARAAG